MTATVARLDAAWMDDAACQGLPAEVFFPEVRKSSSYAEGRLACDRCQVRAECLDYALATDERFGMWGGTSPDERSSLRRHGARRRAS